MNTNYNAASAASKDRAAFAAALPRIERVARHRFRRVGCPDRREDCVREAVALCWISFLRLAARGRAPETFVTALARYASRAVARGRRAAGCEAAGDIMTRPRTLRKAARTRRPIPERTAFDDALADNTRTPVPQQVQFRCDLRAWKARLTEAKRRLVDALVLGHRTRDLAEEFGLSAGRISQLRKEFAEDYAAFCGT